MGVSGQKNEIKILNGRLSVLGRTGQSSVRRINYKTLFKIAVGLSGPPQDGQTSIFNFLFHFFGMKCPFSNFFMVPGQYFIFGGASDGCCPLPLSSAHE